jgi:hypothetical protein
VVRLGRPVHTSFTAITRAKSRHSCILPTSWSTGWLRLTLILISVIVRGICLRKRWNHNDQDFQRDGPQILQGGRGARCHWLEAIHGGYDLLLTQRLTGNLHHSQRIQRYRRAMPLKIQSGISKKLFLWA